ncbi:MAG: chalcone isomerase family protein [Colwellia sp.]
MFKNIFCFIVFTLFCHSAFATPIKTQSSEQSQSALNTSKTQFDHLSKLLESHSLVEIGNTTFSILFWDLYQSKLATTSGQYPLNGKNDFLLYEIKYLADISSDDLIKRTEEQWQHIGLAENEYQGFVSELKVIWPDISKGDTLSLLVDSEASHFYFNEAYIGSLVDESFGKVFLDIWLAENTSQPDLRAELLGEANNEKR